MTAAATDDRTITSVLARGLVDPRFARALLGRRGRRRMPAAEGAVARTLDARRLALFAGFITMVRHQGELQVYLPGTLALLRRHGLELAVFRDHFLAALPATRDRDQRTAAAVAHLARFAQSRRGRAVPGLAAVLRHEQCRWQLARELAGWRVSRRGLGELDARAVLSPSGPLRVLRLDRSPWSVLDALARGVPVEPAARPCWLLYWADPATRELRTIAVDRAVARVIEAVDGRRTLAALAVALRGRVSAPRLQAIARSVLEAGALQLAARSR